MDSFLRQGTSVSRIIGPFVDVTDPATRRTSLTIANTDVKLSINGGALFISKIESSSATHIANGYYRITLGTTDTGSVGTMKVMVNDSGSFPVAHDFVVLSANVYDSLIAASDNLQVTGVVGTGAYTVTVTVDDGTDPLENATVRMKASAGNDNVGVTDANGQVTFSLDAATYTVTITLSGYSFTSTTLAVSGADSQTYSMTATTITPSDPGRTTGFFTCYDEFGVVEQGVAIHSRVNTPYSSVAGLAYDKAVRSETSDENGLVEFTNLVKGTSYDFWRGDREQEVWTVIVSSSAGDSVALDSITGEG